MKVMHVLNSRIYSGAEKVVCQIIHAFADTPGMEMVYCSPYSDNVRQMLAQEGGTYLPVESLTPGQLRQVLREQKPDLIHAHDMRAGFVAALCCGRTPLISHIHNNAYDARGLSLKSVAYLIAGAKARHIFWVSRSAYEGYCFHALFAKKSQVLYNVIDRERILTMKEQDPETYDFDLIYVGRLTYQKDPQRLMRLCALLRQQRPELRAAVVGAGELEQETKALCRELGLEDNVQFLGFQSNPMKMIHDSRALVLTSRWEGTPMCALEAMALGVPVVSTPSDGLKDILENGVNGYLCESDEELARQLLEIFRDPAHRAALSRNAVETFARINDSKSYYQAIAACYR